MPVVRKFGIDFGTTNSSISLLEKQLDGTTKIKVFAVDRYDMPFEIIRSVVGYKGNETFIGNEGLEHLTGSEDNPIRQVKMQLIESENDSVALILNDKRKYFSDVMADILRRLREKALEQLQGVHIDGVVMGVPYETPEVVKQIYLKALVNAGFYNDDEEAGINTEFVEEPIAVALHYGHTIAHQNKYAMVFDFGGGTLDMAVVELKEQSATSSQTHKVLAKGGFSGAGEEFTKAFFLKGFFPAYRDTHCNGSAWELAKLFKQMGCRANNAEGIWYEMERSGIGWKFINKLDEIKIRLSTEESVFFNFECSTPNEQVAFKNILLTRKMFEDAIAERLNEIRASINRMFSSAKCKNIGVTKLSIDEVLLAGGSSMIPCVRNLLCEMFGANKVFFDKDVINVMTSISQGLAYAGYRESDFTYIDDICNFDYGIWDDIGKEIYTIIPKNTSISDTDTYDFSKKWQPPIDYKFKVNVEQVDRGATAFGIDLYEGNKNIMHLTFDKTEHSGLYTLYFKIDAKRSILQVFVWDNGLGKWIDDLPIGDRSFQINSMQ